MSNPFFTTAVGTNAERGCRQQGRQPDSKDEAILSFHRKLLSFCNLGLGNATY
jgi:hypothetical protein